MIDHRRLDNLFTEIIRRAIKLEILLFNSKPYTRDSIGLKFYYNGTSLVIGFICLAFINRFENIFASFFLFILFLASTFFCSFALFKITKDPKIDLSDEFLIRIPVRKVREQLCTNLGFNFTVGQLKGIFEKMKEFEFLKSKTSFESFQKVFMSDFGHEDYVQWNITLSQTGLIFEIMSRYSSSFSPALAVRKKLFKTKKGSYMKIDSFNTAKNSRNKKNEEYFFHENLLQFDDYIRRLIDKNV
ncbi:MAG: hypothetical protein ABJN95_17040 [Maribacter sp.]|uniref:hypothetical protein n=1 Tax=Maribacter sp. TaxID=1897614 RepID=UPI00329A5E68